MELNQTKIEKLISLSRGSSHLNVQIYIQGKRNMRNAFQHINIQIYIHGKRNTRNAFLHINGILFVLIILLANI